MAPLIVVLVLIVIRIQYGVLLFHTLAELFSVMVGVLMLVIAWNTRRFTQNDFLLYLGIGYFWVAVLDTWHTFTVNGMPFLDITDAEIPLHFWIYTRLIEAVLLLSAVLFLKKKLNAYLFLYGGAVLVLLVVWASLSLKRPIMLTPDGLTFFKVSVEYIVMALLAISIYVYIRHKDMLASNVLYLLLASMVLTILAEISFTLYTSFTGIPFVLGHLFKFLSFWVVFQAIVRTTLTEPFSVMAQVSSTYDAIPHAVIVVDQKGIISQVNHAASKLAGKPVEKLIHNSVHDLFHLTSGTECELCQSISEGRTFSNLTTEFMREDKWFLVSQTLIKTGEMAGGVVQMYTDITDRRVAEQRLAKNEAQLRTLINALPDLIWLKDVEGVYQGCNQKFERLYGTKEENIIGRTDYDFVDREQADFFREKDKKAMAAGKPMMNEEELIFAGDGHREIMETIKTPMLDSSGNVIGVLGVGRDITQRKQADEKIRLLSATVDQSPVSIIITDAKANIEYVNPAFEQVTGYRLDEVMGKNPRLLKSGNTPKGLYKDLWHAITQGKTWGCEIQNRKKNGEIFWERAHFASVKNSEGIITHYLAVKEDITERKRQQEKILHQAHYDALTDLPNRFLSLDRLSQLISEAVRNKDLVAVLFIDLDDFKKINDSLGHETGDKLLVEAASRLNSLLRSGDTVGRLGGDEFIILLGGLADASDAQPIAENLLAEFREPFDIDGRELMITASVGISVFPGDGGDSSELLCNADSAMYHSKDLGRNTYSYFTDAMNQNVLHRLSLEEQIHGALERKEFAVYYQSKVDMHTGKIMGAEALLRWNNPALGNVSPVEFIPIAEQTGLIIPIGQFVLTEALQKAVEWQQKFNAEFRIAVNVSPRQFRDPDLVPFIERTINETGIQGQYLELEITEGVLMSGHGYIDEALAEINNLQISIAMDDFGTGYSSLSYLRSYPFDVLKIDRSFVNDITIDPADRELTNAAIAMAHGLNLKVVAEGVETEQQLALLKELNCDYAQGYLFSKPITAKEMTELLKQ